MKQLFLALCLLITVAGFTQITPPTTPSTHTVVLSGVEFKDQSNPNFNRIKIKNNSAEVSYIQLCYSSFPVYITLDPGDHITVIVPCTMVEMVVLQPVYGGSKDIPLEYTRAFGLLKLKSH